MTSITLAPDRLSLHFTRWEKTAGLLFDLDVPFSQIVSVDVVADGRQATKGVRAPGLGVPNVLKLGTWRGRGSRSLVAVRRREPALVLHLSGARFDRVVVSHPRARDYADRLRGLLR